MPSPNANASTAAQLAKTFPHQNARARLLALRATMSGRLVFTSSLGLEDQVITHFIATAGVDIELVTLDTGRMFPQTYDVWTETEHRYGLRIQPLYPDAAATEALVARQGINGFYKSIEQRHACCHIRKAEPLERALAGATGWITGLRADASGNRAGMKPVKYDEARGLIKYSPLFDWSREQAAEFAARENVPVNVLHAQGFPSIGCAPCTRAVAPGEPERAGRWWWEQDEARECGLHIDESGRLVRTSASGVRESTVS